MMWATLCACAVRRAANAVPRAPSPDWRNAPPIDLFAEVVCGCRLLFRADLPLVAVVVVVQQ